MIEGNLENQVLDKKIFICEKLDQVDRDNLYFGIDISSEDKSTLVVKVSTPEACVGKELKVLNKIKYTFAPVILAAGIYQKTKSS